MRYTMFVAALLLLARPLAAHEPRLGPNGGALVDAGAYHVELAMRGTTVELFVSDSADKPLPAAGFKAIAVLVIEGAPQRVVLQPVTGNRLSGQAAIAAVGPPKGVVLLTGPDGKTAQARVN